MQPNILFILIDGLRADQFFGKKKKSYTPFFDSLVSKGVYFENTFSSSDGTTISLNCTLNSRFQFETGIRARKLVLFDDNHIQTLKDSGYNLVGITPNLTSLKPLTDFFENNKKTFEPGPPPESLPVGLAQRIESLLNSLKDKQPWFCYLHLFDLHPLREGRIPEKIENFNSEKYGDSYYSKTVSSIDFWLKKILDDVDLSNTLLIITADHGERIPFNDKHLNDFEPELKTITKLGKNLLPESTHNLGGKILGNVKQRLGKAKLNKSNNELTQYQKRSRDPYFTLSLHDELLHVPFLLSGLNLTSKVISKQTSTLSIFPTIFDLLNISQKNYFKKQSVLPLIQDKNNFQENKIYLHTSPYEEESQLDMEGIRTSKHKFFRHSRDSKKNIHLYDLENDPYENYDLSENNPEVIAEMEKLLKDLKKNTSESNSDITEEEEEEISKELKKLGYL
tara:strand:- start:5677 stop:7029 length:1353 start_codon:yes stop_codon:yes gene_type:complete